MSNWINVKGAVNNLEELKKQLTGKQLAIGISRGINSSLMKGRTEARNAVKAEYNIPTKNLSGVNYSKSFPSTLTGNIYASTKPIPMDAFSPVFQKPQKTLRVSKKGEQKVTSRKRGTNKTGEGVSIEVHKGKRMIVPFAFMIEGAKPRVFARGEYKIGSWGFTRRNTRKDNSSGNDSVKPLISTTIHAAVVNNTVIGKISDKLNNVYPKDIEHELRFLISKLPNKANV